MDHTGIDKICLEFKQLAPNFKIEFNIHNIIDPDNRTNYMTDSAGRVYPKI